jgi:hypothetical protein
MNITRNIFLPTQDGIIPIKLAFELTAELLYALLVRCLSEVLLDHPFPKNASRDRIKLVLNARRLLELRAGLGLGGDQLRAGPEGGDIACDGARLEQLEAIVLLINDCMEAMIGGEGVGGRRRTAR